MIPLDNMPISAPFIADIAKSAIRHIIMAPSILLNVRNKILSRRFGLHTQVFALEIIPNSPKLLDNLACKFQCVTLLKFEPHYDLQAIGFL
jgi:hypothetical protein